MALQYEFVQVVVADFYGVHRGHFIPGSRLENAIKNGTSLPYGVFIMDPNGDDPEKTVLRFLGSKHGNSKINLVKETLHSAGWLSRDGSKVGEIIAEVNLTPELSCPRTLARKQIAALSDIGLKLYSGFEREVTIIPEISKPIDQREDSYSVINMARYQSYIQKVCNLANEAGIEIESVYKEQGPNKMEFVLAPTEGLKSADDTFILKEILKCIALENSFTASFMSRNEINGSGNTSDLNISFIDDAGGNVFYDQDAEDHLSSTVKHVLAGLIAHGPALCALCSPTVDCYRRVGLLCAAYSDWGMDDRKVGFRAKIYPDNAVVIENRLCRGPCNPYLAMAGTLAAALDGIKRELELPEPNSPKAQALPTNLEMALKAFEEDHTMRDALGDTFVDCYVSLKREIDLTILQNPDYDMMLEEEQLKREKEFYGFTM